MAAFCEPYIRSGQSLVVNIEATPHVRSIDHLTGMVIGVQHGNTSEPVAHRLKEERKVADVRTYPYHDIGLLLDDLAAGATAPTAAHTSSASIADAEVEGQSAEDGGEAAMDESGSGDEASEPSAAAASVAAE